MMLSCREATRMISESVDHPLTWNRRVRLRIHLLLCTYCARFEAQSHWLKAYSNRYFGGAEGACQGECLSAEARARIEQALSEERE